jgi:hydrogenase-4 membrane subunit HyfE
VSEVLAGFICGYALALVSAPLVALALLRLRSRVPTVARAVPEQVPVVALTVVIFGFTFLLWSALGIFACAVACIPPALMLRSGRRYVIAAAVVFVGVFGWLMPYLAQWGPIASS